MSWPQSGHRNPSRYMPSTTSAFPIRIPKRARGNRYGVADMHSVPPASTTSFSPAAIVSAPSVMAFSDEAQALLTVKAGTESGNPARRPTCRAVFGPPPAWRAWPKIVSSTAGGRQARALDRGPSRRRAELGRRQRREGAPELADRGADGGEDVHRSHRPDRLSRRRAGKTKGRPRTQRRRRSSSPPHPNPLPPCGGRGGRTWLVTPNSSNSSRREKSPERSEGGGSRRGSRSEESAGRSSPHPGEPRGGARRRGAQTPNAAEATS